MVFPAQIVCQDIVRKIIAMTALDSPVNCPTLLGFYRVKKLWIRDAADPGQIKSVGITADGHGRIMVMNTVGMTTTGFYQQFK